MKSSYLHISKTFLLAVSFLLLLPWPSHGDPGNQYCITPPFITAGIKPNLLLMIDNSASMYDLAYQDTANKYCTNNPTTQCTADSQCASAGQAFCVGSYATTGGAVTKAACNTNADCQKIVPGDTCVLTGARSSRNLCTSATVTTAMTINPIGCSTNSECTSSGGTCPAGATCTWAASDTCNNTCSANRQCYDTTYTPYTSTSNYYGYFDAAATYSYANNKFTSGATIPATCTYSAGTPAYYCVNTTGTGAAEAVVADATGFVASGNFLNWLTASKFDQEKKILTGGKFNASTGANFLVSETRGCGGREFIKAAGTLTFAIRGGTLPGIGTTQNLSTEYGQTYIEIYTGTYNASDCLKAVSDWTKVASGVNVNLGTFSGDTKGCVGAGSSDINATNTWNHSLHNCYQGMTGGAQGYRTNQNSIEQDCKSMYATIAPNEITDPNSGYAICSSALTYSINGTAYTGYLGACWNGAIFDNACFLTRMQNYCEVNVKTNPVADPSSTAVTSSTSTASIPGFVMQQGLNNLTRVGIFLANVALATPPSGLVDKYGSRIRMGAMTFQNNGSGSECGSTDLPCGKACYSAGTGFTTRTCIASTDCPTGSGQTCEPLPKSDGGQIVAYVGAGTCSATTTTSCTVDSDCPSGQYCQPSVGNHSSGLINSIDSIPATSWTPFAEAFYNALGYFSRTNDYGTNPPTSRDFNFSILGPNTATSYDTSKNPSQFRCQSNNILLITDGMSTADRHSVSEGLATLYASVVPYTISTTTYKPGDAGYDAANVHGGSTCPAYSGSRSISDLAWVAKNRNIKTLASTGTASTDAPTNSSESIMTYVVYSGPQTSSQTGLCDPKTLMENTAKNGGTTLLSAANPQSLYDEIDSAFSSVAAKAASGTAASILSNSEGSGANILQAVFYPQKIFANDTSANWIGEMQNLWYYVDPYINNSTIREDSNGDLKLNLINDKVANFYFDNSADKTMVQLYSDSNGDGSGDTAFGSPIDPDFVKSIWRAGKLLWSRNITTTGTNSDPRKIKTTINGTSLIDFSSATIPGAYPEGAVPDNSTALASYLNVAAAQAPTLINWVHGIDFPSDSTFRKRYVEIKDPAPATTFSSGIWKLGDIISSTPRVQSTVRLNSYNLAPSAGYSDKTYESFINTSNYKSRGMVYVGANDGMLHAFKLGLLKIKSNATEKATLEGSNLGREEWAFIPRNFLPYLKYLSDPHYEHLYAVDGRTVLLDASIGDGTVTNYWDATKTVNSWRTIVIGSMGIGGATRSSCTGDVACVQTPIADPTDGSKYLGYSSYFALDVTDQNNPQLLWEFSSNQLGFSTTGPAIVRVGDRNKNGHWYAVFGNGPFGPIDTDTHQLRAASDHHLRFFIVDLKTGVSKTITTDIDNAFAGSMLGGSIDADRRAGPGVAGNYQDDAIYAGYVKYSSTDDAWTDGGVVRIMTKESMTPDDATNPWTYSKVIDGIGPVTTSIARLQDTRSLNKNLWLFFGTGRYYYRDGASLDDYSNRRALFGIKEPCYNTASKPGNFLDGNCTAAVSGTLVDQTSSVSTVGASDPGWRINLNISTTDLGAERVVTDPVALTNGSVLFTTFKPTMDKCGYGGNSFLRIVSYNNGGAPSCNSLQGKVLVQLSTGEFKEISLAEAYGCPGTPPVGIMYPPPDYRPPGDGGEGGGVNPPTTPPPPVPVGGGKPPSDAPPVISSSSNRPLKKILHIQEH